MNLAGRDIQLAIFDLDGTLLDSTGVWDEIDRDFFAKRNMRVPVNYGRTIVHMGLEKGAEWTRDNFCPDEKPEDILAEWRAASKKAYEEDISLKVDCTDVLELFLAHDVHLSAATANSEDLYLPCLKRLQILDYFENVVDVNSVKEGKSSSKIYDEITAKYGLSKENVIVFEDSLAAMATAHDAGYLTVGVFDEKSNKGAINCEDKCDLFIEDWGTFCRQIKAKRPLPILEKEGFIVRRFCIGYEIMGFIHDSHPLDLVVPQSIEGRPVLSIDAEAFENHLLHTVTLPNGLREIHESAFRGVKGAAEIVIPASVQSISYCAFCESSFSKLVFEGYVLGMFCSFVGMDNLRQIVFPSTFTRTHFRAFMHNTALEEVDLPEGMTHVAMQTFKDCSSLRKVTLPTTLKRIAPNAFYRCPKIAEVIYRGSEEEKAKINIDKEGNETLLAATWRYLK